MTNPPIFFDTLLLVHRLHEMDMVATDGMFKQLNSALRIGLVIVVHDDRVWMVPKSPQLQWFFDAYGA